MSKNDLSALEFFKNFLSPSVWDYWWPIKSKKIFFRAERVLSVGLPVRRVRRSLHERVFLWKLVHILSLTLEMTWWSYYCSSEPASGWTGRIYILESVITSCRICGVAKKYWLHVLKVPGSILGQRDFFWNCRTNWPIIFFADLSRFPYSARYIDLTVVYGMWNASCVPKMEGIIWDNNS